MLDAEFADIDEVLARFDAAIKRAALGNAIAREKDPLGYDLDWMKTSGSTNGAACWLDVYNGILLSALWRSV